jgi:DNA polymerase/3'-5' exonuclease PolX
MEIGCVCLKPIAQKTNRVLDVLERAVQSRLPRFNEVAAERLREAAILLAHQGDSPYRVAAYRRAADAVAALPSDLRELLDTGGIKALEEIPGVGSRIAGGLAELARTGRWTYLERAPRRLA